MLSNVAPTESRDVGVSMDERTHCQHEDWGRRGETCEMKKKWRRLDRLAIFGDMQTLGAKTVDSNVDVAILAGDLFRVFPSARVTAFRMTSEAI